MAKQADDLGPEGAKGAGVVEALRNAEMAPRSPKYARDAAARAAVEIVRQRSELTDLRAELARVTRERNEAQFWREKHLARADASEGARADVAERAIARAEKAEAALAAMGERFRAAAEIAEESSAYVEDRDQRREREARGARIRSLLDGKAQGPRPGGPTAAGPHGQAPVCALHALTPHVRRLAPYAEGAWCRRDGASLLYLKDSAAPGGQRAVRCRDATITALCDAGVLEEERTATGGVRDCTSVRAPSAGAAEDVGKRAPMRRGRRTEGERDRS